MKRLIIIVLGLLLAGGDASAQEWVQTNGPGGDVYGMFFNKKNIFISNIRSADKGITWNPIQNEVYAVGPNGDIFSYSYLSFSSHVARIIKSTDNGDTWDSIASLNTSNLVISTDNTIYAGDYGALLLFRSTNNGSSWDSLPLPNGAVDDYIAIDSSGILFTASNQCVFRSTNKGGTWSKITAGLELLEYGKITCGKNNNMYINDNYANRAFRSSDEGKTWVALPFRNGFFASSPSGMLLFAGSDSDHGIIKYSYDAGISWKDFGGLTHWKLDTASVTFLCADLDSGFYLQVNGILFYANHPDTNPWRPVSFPLSQVSAIIVSSNGNLIASTLSQNTQNILSISRDTGKSWLPVTDTIIPNGIQLFARDSNNGIIGVGNKNLFRSINNGKNWVQLRDPSDTTLFSCVVHPNGNIFLSAEENTIYRSTDNALTWSKIIPNKYGEYYYLSIVPNRGIFASNFAGYISSDYGETWALISIDFPRFLGLFSVVGDLYGDLYTSSDYTVRENMTVLRSFDNGLRWTMFDKGLDTSMQSVINGLLETHDGTIFAYTNSGVYKHAIGDCFWTPFSDGLSAKAIISLTYDKEGKLYAGSYGGGVFKSTQTFNKIPKLSGRLLPGSIIFDSIPINSTICENVTLKNIGLQPFTIKSFTVTDPIPFSVADESAKKLPVTLNPKDSVTMSICFHPYQPAVYASSIVWNTDIDASLCTGIPSESALHGVAVIKSSVAADKQDADFSIQPNPIQDKAEIHFSLTNTSYVKVECFDMLGRSLKVLAEGNYVAGENTLPWDSSNLADGGYIVQCTIDSTRTSQTVIVSH